MDNKILEVVFQSQATWPSYNGKNTHIHVHTLWRVIKSDYIQDHLTNIGVNY